MSRFEQKVVIKETHLDVFGHMNNATYLQIFEEARWDLIVSRGFNLEQIKKSKTGPVILECNIKFLKELQAREEITVTVEQLLGEGEPHPKIFKLKQQMLSSKGEIACEAIFTYGLFDLENRRLIAPTPEWKYAVSL